MFALTLCGAKLSPTSEGLHGTLVAVSYWLIWKAASVTYWNVQVVSRPNGLTVAFRVALVSVTASPPRRRRVGGPAMSVVNVWSLPFTIPSALVATARK